MRSGWIPTLLPIRHQSIPSHPIHDQLPFPFIPIPPSRINQIRTHLVIRNLRIKQCRPHHPLQELRPLSPIPIPVPIHEEPVRDALPTRRTHKPKQLRREPLELSSWVVHLVDLDVGGFTDEGL